jgi:signal transduction histidine kinase
MNKKRASIYILTIILGLLIVQGAFFFLQSTQVNSATSTIQTLLRQETSVSNTFLISRTLSDLRDSKMIKCVKLTEVSNKQMHLDMRFKDSCGQSFLSLNGKEVSTILRGLNGDLWQIEFQSVNDKFFGVSLWLSRALLTIIIIFITWFYFNRSDQLKQGNEKKDKLKNLAEQAAHDVASPLTLMNALIASNLISEEAKKYLKQVNNSIHGIVGSLREQSNIIENDTLPALENVNLTKIVKSVIKEKQIKFPNISHNLPELIIVRANTMELERVVSNILNNAIEASNSQKKIDVSVILDNPNTLKISDQGIGIPPHILSKLGTKGETFGKAQGTGLGLFHAKNCMESWGGSLRIQSTTQQGTIIFLEFKPDY